MQVTSSHTPYWPAQKSAQWSEILTTRASAHSQLFCLLFSTSYLTMARQLLIVAALLLCIVVASAAGDVAGAFALQKYTQLN